MGIRSGRTHLGNGKLGLSYGIALVIIYPNERSYKPESGLLGHSLAFSRFSFV